MCQHFFVKIGQCYGVCVGCPILSQISQRPSDPKDLKVVIIKKPWKLKKVKSVN